MIIETIRTTMTWWEALLVIAAYIVPALVGGVPVWVGLIASILVGVCFGVWRLVRLVGQLVIIKQVELDVEEGVE